jgi:polysaccharide biosynthesis/export protein
MDRDETLTIGPILTFWYPVRSRVKFNFLTLILVLFMLFALVLPSYGQQRDSTSRQVNEKIQSLAAMDRVKAREVSVGTGDLLHIEVFDVPELTRDVRVGDTGEFSYPLIPGRISAVGLTPYQLEEKMQRLLIENGLVTHPQVSVFVKEQNSQGVSVVGAIQKPMVYQIVRPTTLLEILSNAGGISEDAGSIVIITRGANPSDATDGSNASSPAPQIITIRLQDLLESGDPVYNIPVYGGDVVSLPKAGIVYVTGAGVSQPGGYVLQSHGDQITALRAIALAHGMSGFAKANDAVIFRPNPITGKNDIIPVRLGKIQNRKAEDVPMKAKDILYVPDSAGRKILARGAEAAVSVGTGLAIYRGGP